MGHHLFIRINQIALPGELHFFQIIGSASPDPGSSSFIPSNGCKMSLQHSLAVYKCQRTHSAFRIYIENGDKSILSFLISRIKVFYFFIIYHVYVIGSADKAKLSKPGCDGCLLFPCQKKRIVFSFGFPFSSPNVFIKLTAVFRRLQRFLLQLLLFIFCQKADCFLRRYLTSTCCFLLRP